MTKYYIHKPIYSLLLVLTSHNGQTSNQSQAEKKTEPKLISTGQPKLVKTQGSRENDNIHCSLQDKAGNLWFGTTGEGVYRYDGKIFTQFTKKDGLNSNGLYSILVDKSGNIWFSGEEKLSTVESDGGIWSYDSKTFKNYNNIKGMNKYAVFSMLQDKNGDIWVGTTNTGLYKFDGKFLRIILNSKLMCFIQQIIGCTDSG